MAGTRRDLEGWQNAVNFMLDKNTGMGFFTARRFEQHPEEAADVVSYLNSVFGIDSDLARSPADLPGYKDVVTHFSDDGLKVIYVSYELSGGSRFAWNAAEDKDGDYWMPFYGNGNRIGRLDPKTGKVDEFPVPNVGTAAIHSAVPASDGSVWLTEQATNKIGRWDPVTQKITEYQAPRGGKHTVRVDSKGNVWTTGSPLSRFDLETQKFTEINEVPNADGIAIDKSDNVWFAQFQENGKIGRVDAKTGQVKMWLPPTGASAHPRRINIDANGIVWFGEYTGGKIGSFDPKTETFKEYPIPTASPTPYAITIDKNNDVWFSERDMDIMGRLDQKTGKITEYPTPYPENTMRDFMTDSKGRVWWTSPANNKVGYLMLSNVK